ncbi:MAG: SHOCT domain-containing protein [Aggregatilineales bacterium]
MRRLLVIFGVALMVFAFVILTIFIIAPAVFMPLDNAPLLKDILQIAVCNSNEVLTADYSTYDTPTSTTVSVGMNCVDSQQNARDVSQQLIQIGAIGYLGPFLIGLFMALLAGSSGEKQTKVPAPAVRNHRPRSWAASQAESSSPTVGSDRADRNARPETLDALLESREQSRAEVSSLNPSGQAHSQTQDQPDHLPLAQRLRELKEAYHAGLMTEAEYQEKRREVLNES